jgi:hypothetical protein
MILTLYTPTIYFFLFLYIDTYSISDNESTTNSVDLIDTNTVKLEGELNRK